MFSSGDYNVLNIPDSSLQVGLYWQALSDADSGVVRNNNNIYISWGFFEDKILNENLGMGTSKKQVLQGDGAINYDSSNSFFTFNHSLYKRQIRSSDIANEGLQFLYPNKDWGWNHDAWGKGTYSTIRKKVPDDHIFDDEGKKRRKQLKTKDDVKLKRVPMREMYIPLSTVKDALRDNTDINGVLRYIFSF